MRPVRSVVAVPLVRHKHAAGAQFVTDAVRGLESIPRQARKEGIWKLGLEGDDLELAISLASGSELEKCEPGTRVDILTQIRNWFEDEGAVEQIFWLNDAAGTGKSTVAATMAGEWLQRNRLVGRFFFSPNVLLNQKVKYFCRTVALDLLDRFPNLLNFIEAELAASPEVCLDLRNQFHRLIITPLKMAANIRPMVLIIDALDNCEHYDRQTLLHTLLEQLPQHPRLKVLLTSRPAPDIVSTLTESHFVTGKDIQLHNVNQPAQEDIALYIHSRLSFFDIEERERVIRHSAGLFIYAATFCRAVGQSRLRARLLENLSHSQVTDPLDALYLGVLNQALIDIEAKPELRKVLQVIISAFQPVSINSLISFLPKIYQIDDFVQDLAGVIKDGHPDRPLKVLHPTFREFIVSDEDRANGFLLHTEPSHSLLAAACLNLLERSLKYDLLSLRKEDQLLPQNSQVQHLDQIIASSTTAALRYASSYWAQHIVAAGPAWVEWGSVTRFLCDHFLHWVELVSWQGAIGTAVSALARLNLSLRRIHIASDTVLVSNDALAARHAHQFLTRYQSVISDNALQTYTAPAELLPPHSLLRRRRSDSSAHGLRILTEYTSDWGSQIVLTGHRSEVLLVKLSPDASRAATVGIEGSFRLWNTETGESIGPVVPEVTMDSGVRYAEFSSDSLKVAFASAEGQLHLWDAQSGIPIWQVTAEPAPVSRCTHIRIRLPDFLPYVALALYDREAFGRGSRFGSIIRLYDITTGDQLEKTFSIRDRCSEFYFSPDGRRCVSNCLAGEIYEQYGNIRLFDTETTDILQEVKFPFSKMHGVDHGSAYSKDGTRIVFASGREPFILLDGDSGQQIVTVDKDEPPSSLVRFAPRGEYMASIASAPDDPDIVLWDKRNGTRLLTIHVSHGTQLGEVWFSHDMARIAAHSDDESVQVWELETRTQVQGLLTGTIPRLGNSNRPAMVLPEDWTKALIQNTLDVDLYDLTVQTTVHSRLNKRWRKPPVGAITDNPSIFVGLASIDDADSATMAIWDASCGTPKLVSSLGVVKGYSLGVMIAHRHQEAVFYSQRGVPITFFSLKSHGRVQRTLEGEKQEGFRHYAMSPDESLIVGGCKDYIQVWEYTTGTLFWELPEALIRDRWGARHGPWQNFVFSSDNTLLCGTDSSNNIYAIEMSSNRWWNSSEAWSPIALAIDSQKSLLAVAQEWGAVCLYRLTDKAIVRTFRIPDTGKRGETFRLGFSNDARYLVHGSRVWRVRGDQTLEEYRSHLIPQSLVDYPYSFLTYQDGWIHSAFPPGPLVPVPAQQQDHFQYRDAIIWSAYKDVVLAWEAEGRPMLWDVSRLVSHQYE